MANKNLGRSLAARTEGSKAGLENWWAAWEVNIIWTCYAWSLLFLLTQIAGQSFQLAIRGSALRTPPLSFCLS